MDVFQRKSTVLLLLVVNLAIPVTVLAYKYTHQSRTREVHEPSLFDSPRPDWINILTSEGPITVHSNSLNLSLYASFPSAVVPASVTLTDNRNLNIFDEVVFWGGQSRLTSRQLLVQPAFDFYPGPIQLNLNYSSLDGVRRQMSSQIRLIFDDNFRAFGVEKGRKPTWYFSPGVERLPESSESQGIVCEPGEQEKTELVFLKTYQQLADVTLEFRPRTATPNLSVSFSERVSFIVGDGVDDQIKFKHKLADSHRYYQKIWRTSKIVPGQTYIATVRRRKNEYFLRLTDSALRELISVNVVDPIVDDTSEKYPFIAFWVFSNLMQDSRAIKAVTEIHRTEIYYPHE